MLSDRKICFIGAGAMAEAILTGMLSKRIIKPSSISVTNRSNQQRLKELATNFEIVASVNQKNHLIQEADVLILAMKPHDVATALQEIQHLTHEDQLVISVLAGITTDYITKLLGHTAPVIRAMPNTSAAIGFSATGVSSGMHVASEHMVLAVHIFESIGTVTEVDEKQIDAVTAVSGSGPAYIYYLTEAMISGGVKAGLDPKVARELTVQTLVGAAEMIAQTGEDPATLRKNITSPNGTTEAALNTLQLFEFEQAVISCILKAKERAVELGALFTETE